MTAFMGTNITLWNCQGIRSKRKELKLYLKENKFDIVSLNETLLTNKVDFKIQGYNTIKNDRSAGTRGGVTFLVKHGLVINKEYCNIDLNTITDNEALATFLNNAESCVMNGGNLTVYFHSEGKHAKAILCQHICSF